ncbi:MAG TPA: hypothetical protein O0X99_01560 [Methanocorpusculum sp.]|nr:hypothetical protein [Methanocorpusculum sp.]
MINALKIKNVKYSVHTFQTIATNLIILSLKRANNTGSILAMRGYTNGGSYKPIFKHNRSDYLLLLCAITSTVICIGYQYF